MLQMLQKIIELASRPAVILCWALLSVVVATAGPFGSFQSHSFVVLLGFWAIIIGLSILLANVVALCAAQVFANLSVLAREVLCLGIFSTLFTPIVWGLSRLILGPEKPLPLSVPVIFLFIAVIAGSTILLRMFFLRESSGDAQAAAEMEKSPFDQPPILARLNECKRGSVIAVSARDHYVDVVTDKGTDQLLMRFGDAIGELQGVQGVRVHRSHWVAQDAVTTAERRNGRLFLKLQNGVEIPVSRNYRADVERAGLL